jgi:hypothetical protein
MWQKKICPKIFAYIIRFKVYLSNSFQFFYMRLDTIASLCVQFCKEFKIAVEYVSK